jgi:hypothetical protein
MFKTRTLRRLDRVEGALAAARPKTEAKDDGRELAAELDGAFGRMVGLYREHYKLSPDEAFRRASEAPEHFIERAQTCAPSQVSWDDLGGIARVDPEKALARWEEVKDAACGELRAGHRAARALEGYESHCWDRAQFLAVRSELSAAWRPRNAAEQQLIDQMAQCQELIWHWLVSMTAYRQMAVNGTPGSKRQDGTIEPPRLSYVEAMERAARMVDRFHALYLRSFAALRQLRRLPPVVVRAGGQVNIGGRQVNMAGPGGR